MKKAIKEEVSFYEASDFLMNEQISKRHSVNTIEAYKHDLDDYAVFLKTYQDVYDVLDITYDNILKYIASLKRRGLSKTSISRKITTIRQFHKFLYEENISKENIAKNLKLPKSDSYLPVTLTIKEINLMIDSIDETNKIGIRNRAMLEVLFACGLRVSELLDLKLQDLHLKARYLDVIGKGNKERYVPLDQIALDALLNYLNNAREEFIVQKTNYVFLNYKGSRMSRQGFFKFIKQLSLKCNIDKNVSPHTIRHTCATTLLRGGADIRVIQNILGHSSVGTTEIYTHINRDELKDIYDKTHPKIINKENENEF